MIINKMIKMRLMRVAITGMGFEAKIGIARIHSCWIVA